MTKGIPWKLILGFAVPLMLGNVFQQLYAFTDTLVIGRALGINALAALGLTEWLIFTIFGFSQGLTQGISITLSHRYGNNDEIGLKKAYINSVYLVIFLAIIITIIGQIIINPILKLIGVPNEIVWMSKKYLHILFSGIPIIVLYNYLAAILRSLGNSRTPLLAMALASIINIVLDILFVFVLRKGIAGVAIATIISQLLASILCLYKIRNIGVLKGARNYNKIDIILCLKQIQLGIPMGSLNIVTAIGGLVVQSVINGFGVLFIAGYTAAIKLYALLEIAASSYGYAISTYSGQNYGAKKFNRIIRGVKSAIIVGSLTALLMSAIMIFLGKPILKCFITGEFDTVINTIKIGYNFLKILSAFFPLLYVLYIMRSCLQGMGRTVSPLLSSIAQLVMRVSCALILTNLIGEEGVFWGEILAWIAADTILIISYYKFMSNQNINATN